jgi:L-cysteine/cystine lyase
MLIQTLEELRTDLPITQHYAYFQTGSYAPVPESTQRYMTEQWHEENRYVLGLGETPRGIHFAQRMENARQILADLLGVTTAEVAWSDNTTTATRLAVQSLDWQAGDKLALSDVEHVSTLQLACGMTQRLGVTTTVISSGEGATYRPAAFLEQVERHLTPDHKLFILCHVANTDGRRLPVAEAVEIARRRGVKTLVDGAQAVGVVPVRVGEIGADFYSGSAHKWLMGPAGVGFLVVNRNQLSTYNPRWLPTRPEQAPTAAAHSELGTPNHVLRLGAGHSIEMLQRIGLGQVEAHMKLLTEQLRQELHSLKGVRNAGPTAWEHSGSITTLQFEGGTPERCRHLVALLRERHQIVTKFRPEVCGIRISISAFNTPDEIDGLLAALAKEIG